MPTKPPVHDPLPAHLRAKVNQQREADKKRRRKDYEAQAQRAEDRRFYGSNRWRDFRAWFLMRNPLCVECKKEGRIVTANQLDHIKPRKTHPELAFEETNCQGLCRRHHGQKTRRGQ